MDPTKRARLGRALPWVIAASCAGLALWLGLGSTPPRSGVGAPPDAGNAPACGQAAECPPPDLAPLRRCLAHLEGARRQGPGEDRRAGADEAAGAGGTLDPRLDELVEARAERILSAERTAREQARTERLAAALALIDSELGLGAEESAWLREYVCSVHELREDSLVDLAERDAGGEADVWQDMRLERDEALAGLEAVLGPERFGRLRSIGGIGLLDDLLDCDDGP